MHRYINHWKQGVKWKLKVSTWFELKFEKFVCCLLEVQGGLQGQVNGSSDNQSIIKVDVVVYPVFILENWHRGSI